MKIGPGVLLLAGVAAMVGGSYVVVGNQRSPPLSAAAAGAASTGDVAAVPSTALARPIAVTSAMPTIGLAATEPRTVRIVVRQGQLVSGPSRVDVPSGAPVAFLVDTDAVDWFAVKGYDVGVPVVPGQVGTIAFSAGAPGAYDFGFDHSGLRLGTLEVGPPP